MGEDLTLGDGAGEEEVIAVEVDEAFAAQVDAGDLRAVIAATLRHVRGEGSAAETVAVLITDDEAVRALNRDYRGVDAATDVLSFAAQEAAEDAPALLLPPELAAQLSQHLGDIVIAYPYAERQAAQFGNSVQAELRLLAVHGTLHLLGFDHATQADEAEMWAVQEAILAPLGDGAVARRTYSE